VTRLGLALALAMLGTSGAQAQDVAGALTAGFVYADGDPGAAALLDVWIPVDVLRFGACFGVGAIPSERDDRNRVMMPVGASVALFAPGEVTFSLRLRGGIWGGATQDVKVTAGGFVGGGAGLGLHLSPAVTLSAVVEAWGLLGAGETWAVVPGLALEWGHPSEDEEDER
jgi:hypothetical protein